jgi:hypothetical protein
MMRRTVSKRLTLMGVVGGLIAGTLLGFAGTTAFAEGQQPTPSAARQQMDRIIDAVHGPGASQKMAQAMGPNGQQLMDRCANQMATQGMMGGQAQR